jgi:hypothetical protein
LWLIFQFYFFWIIKNKETKIGQGINKGFFFFYNVHSMLFSKNLAFIFLFNFYMFWSKISFYFHQFLSLRKKRNLSKNNGKEKRIFVSSLFRGGFCVNEFYLTTRFLLRCFLVILLKKNKSELITRINCVCS